MNAKKLGTSGLKTVWEKVFTLIKYIVGDVDVEKNGTLQNQIKKISVEATTDSSGLMSAEDKKNLDMLMTGITYSGKGKYTGSTRNSETYIYITLDCELKCGNYLIEFSQGPLMMCGPCYVVITDSTKNTITVRCGNDIPTDDVNYILAYNGKSAVLQQINL